MQVEVYAHADAHDDVEAAAERCLAYCEAQGWGRPRPMVTRRDDPLSPDLIGVLMSDRLVALVVPDIADLIHAGVDLARQKAGGRITRAEAKVGAAVQMRDAVHRIVERGVTLCIVDDGLFIDGSDTSPLAEILERVTGTLRKSNADETGRRRERSKDAATEARRRGVRLGRPRKKRED